MQASPATLRRPSLRLSFDDAVEVWKRHALGEAQHHIAQGYGVNQGRICEILKERRHAGSRLAALGKTPPRGLPDKPKA